MLTQYEVDSKEGQHQTLSRLSSHWLSSQHLLNVSQRSHKKLNWTLSFTHWAKPALLIFPVSERNKAASGFSKSVSLGLRVSENVTPPDTMGHFHIVYCVEEHHLTPSKTAIPWETEHWDQSVTRWGASSSSVMSQAALTWLKCRKPLNLFY